MRRRRIIFGVLAVALLAVVAFIVWQLRAPTIGLTTPIELVEIQPGEFLKQLGDIPHK